jgi:hypothetical protein
MLERLRGYKVDIVKQILAIIIFIAMVAVAFDVSILFGIIFFISGIVMGVFGTGAGAIIIKVIFHR